MAIPHRAPALPFTIKVPPRMVAPAAEPAFPDSTTRPLIRFSPGPAGIAHDRGVYLLAQAGAIVTDMSLDAQTEGRIQTDSQVVPAVRVRRTAPGIYTVVAVSLRNILMSRVLRPAQSSVFKPSPKLAPLVAGISLTSAASPSRRCSACGSDAKATS